MLRDWTASESMDSLSAGAEVLFTRLIMKADDYGSFHGNVKLIKAALFPLKDYTDAQVTEWVAECVKAGLVQTYVADGRTFIKIINFGQRLRNMRNIFPQPADKSPQVAASFSECPPELEEKRREVETEESEKAYGPTHKHFIIVKSKYLHQKTSRINGKAGLIEYMEDNKTILNQPEHGDKFMRDANGKVFNELSHVQNAYKLFVKDQFKWPDTITKSISG